VFLNAKEVQETKEYKIKLDWITRITLSPWMPRAIPSSVQKVLRSIDGTDNVKITHSSLTSNESWQSLAERAG
jgi:hypothetical protein